MRTKFQGVWNIINFNRHFYILFGFLILIFSIIFFYTSHPFDKLIIFVNTSIIFFILLSLLVSFYIYDKSNLYELPFINSSNESHSILTIHAGFDEFSSTLESKFPNSQLTVLDFFDPLTHTEFAIKQARLVYTPHPCTLSTKTHKINYSDHSFDRIFILFSAHEIRNADERKLFFEEIRRVLSPNGCIYVLEHLRDLPNFLAYTVGFFHFYSRHTWLELFKICNLKLIEETKHTVFISNYKLIK